MLLSEIFEHLHDAELSQLNLGIEGIEEQHYPKIIRYINLGLIELYKKFDLRTRELILQMHDNITEYWLTYDFAESNVGGAEPVKYIMDGSDPSPFADDVLQVSTIWRENGDQLPLNDANRDESVFTPEDKMVQIPTPIDGDVLSIIYRTYPTKIDQSTTDLPTIIVDLPEHLLTALFAYVGYRAHLGFPEGETSKASNFFARFRGICQTSIDEGIINRNETSNQRLDDGGWA